MNQVHDAIGEIGREVRAVVGAAVLAQAARHINARKGLGQRELYIGVSLVVAQQDVEARLLLLDQVVLERQRLFVISDDNVVDIDGLADQRAGFRVIPSPLMKIGRDARAQVLSLANVNDVAFGVFVQVDDGGSGQAADFLREVHGNSMSDRPVPEQAQLSSL